MKKDNKPLIFLICLLIATAIWFLNSLSDEYETDVKMPVKYTGLPKNKVLINNPPDQFNVRIKSIGSTLFRSKLRLSINSINFNVRAFTRNMMKDKSVTNFRINPNDFIDNIAKQIDSDIEIIDIEPDTLVFKFDNIVKRKVKVADDFQLDFVKQFYQSDSIRFKPDSIWVIGPSMVLDTIKNIKTKPTTFKKISTSIERNISLAEVHSLEFETRRVNVEIPVSHYTEYKEKVKVTVLNLPDSLEIIAFPGEIEVTCLVSLEEYNNISASNFVAGADFSQITEETNELEISIYRHPEKIRNLKFSPHQVEYLIKQK